ncbi:sporulation protein YabP [Mobilisporobacter senegalensis]|uniref:Sporulation protein YabP n=1 Tax=Mobilisporobacter senegalensis TaxID=1329262 RepID=A0A3N1XHR3_9FIRM|nr:sporulation protein YabP [Mobilisporobacter senegalensis]ROR25671.1 sporulation protein YabP [Mobilisporobacter senegalensis]
MEDKQQLQRGHKVNLSSRKEAVITGVNDVLSFDAREVLLETEQGILMLRGDELHVNRLTLEKGEVDIDGRIDSLTYSDGGGYSKSGESLLGRLFK